MEVNERQFKALRNSEKLKILDDVISKPVNTQYTSLFLNSSITRRVFISEYSFFCKDNNDYLYKSFILKNLDTRDTELYIDILELSCYINFFDEKIINNIRNKLLGRYSYLLKLGALDYLLNYKDQIDYHEYTDLNKNVLVKSSNSLVRAQAIINLLALNGKDEYLSKLLQVLKKETAPTLFYRVLNNLLYYSEIEIDNKSITEIISILNKKNFDKKVVKEITKGLHNIIK